MHFILTAFIFSYFIPFNIDALWHISDENGKYDPTKQKHEFTNLFHWTHAVFGNVDGNKNWASSADFFTGMKQYLLTLSVDGYVICPRKGKALDVSFKQSQANGVTQGTYSFNNSGEESSLIWVF